MKVILLKSVSKIGQQNQIKEVPDGFALNFLLPKGLAKKATSDVVAKIEKDKEQKELNNAKSSAEFKEKLKSIQNKPIIIKGKSNEKGHLFKGLHEEDLIKAITKSTGLVLEVNNIKLEKPIKEIGLHDIQIEKFNVQTTLKLSIEKED